MYLDNKHHRHASHTRRDRCSSGRLVLDVVVEGVCDEGRAVGSAIGTALRLDRRRWLQRERAPVLLQQVVDVVLVFVVVHRSREAQAFECFPLCGLALFFHLIQLALAPPAADRS